ncbi:MAG TPA: hypothetical protein VMT67_11435 [Terriglobales bacterium]|nr:hypothetical protein [Terriglobales bacterium]
MTERAITKNPGTKAYQRVRELMSDKKPRTAREIADALELRDTAASSAMRHLERDGKAHIIGWPLNRQGKPAALWVLKPGKSVERPATRKAVGDQVWRKTHAKPEDPSPKPWIETFKPFRDPLVEALFGEYQGSSAAG